MYKASKYNCFAVRHSSSNHSAFLQILLSDMVDVFLRSMQYSLLNNGFATSFITLVKLSTHEFTEFISDRSI